MESRIKIKLGSIEVEYEGSENFLKEELPALIKTVSELYKASEIQKVDDEEKVELQNILDKNKSSNKTIQLSTASIAAKMICKTGSDLIMASAAHISLVKGKETFTRAELLDDMKTAKQYYKISYSKNLSKYLKPLMKQGKIIEPSSGKMSLHADTRKELENNLAN